MLVANRSILYRSTQYKPGDRLPAHNQIMVEAWLKADSARWEDENLEALEADIEPEAEAGVVAVADSNEGTESELEAEAGPEVLDEKPRKRSSKKGEK